MLRNIFITCIVILKIIVAYDAYIRMIHSHYLCHSNLHHSTRDYHEKITLQKFSPAFVNPLRELLDWKKRTKPLWILSLLLKGPEICTTCETCLVVPSSSSSRETLLLISVIPCGSLQEMSHRPLRSHRYTLTPTQKGFHLQSRKWFTR